MTEAMLLHICSTAWLLFLIMDPFGNLPVVTVILQKCDPARYRRILIRELLIALGVMVFALFCGPFMIQLMQLTPAILGISGGIILFLVGVKMVFSSASLVESEDGEPFIVPIAIPLIAGPALVAMLLIQRADTEFPLWACLVSLLLAWLASGAAILCARRLSTWFGPRVIRASESLMGLLLTSISVQMLVEGIRKAFQL